MVSSASPLRLATAVSSSPPYSSVKQSNIYLPPTPVATPCLSLTIPSYPRHHTASRRNKNRFPHTFDLQSQRNLTVKSHLNSPLISPHDTWGIWAVLLGSGALGLWLEKTEIGSMVSSAMVSILIGLAASNVGIVPYEAPTYSIVTKFLLPLTIPLLLFRADMQSIFRSTGSLLSAFLLGSVATVIGTVVAFLAVPMRSLGPDNWKIAAALMGSYIGGGEVFNSSS